MGLWMRGGRGAHLSEADVARRLEFVLERDTPYCLLASPAERGETVREGVRERVRASARARERDKRRARDSERGKESEKEREREREREDVASERKVYLLF